MSERRLELVLTSSDGRSHSCLITNDTDVAITRHIVRVEGEVDDRGDTLAVICKKPQAATTFA